MGFHDDDNEIQLVFTRPNGLLGELLTNCDCCLIAGPVVNAY